MINEEMNKDNEAKLFSSAPERSLSAGQERLRPQREMHTGKDREFREDRGMGNRKSE